jgi:DNA-binding transcriptional MerR regulator
MSRVGTKTIGGVSELTQVPESTIRVWERRRLIPEPGPKDIQTIRDFAASRKRKPAEGGEVGG